VRSALVAILMLPVGVLMAFGAMKLLGIGSNIMSLGGIAIAIGAMVDAAIVMIENAHKRLERAVPGQSRLQILIDAASEVGPALFFSLLIITVSFMPIFTLESQEGRLFSPLAFTKTFAMAAAALLSVTLVPALMVIFVRGRIVPEHKNPINRFLIWIYRPVIKGVMRAKTLVIVLAVAILAVTVWPARQLGTEFMPNLNEGTLLYMPTTLPGISVTKAGELLQTQDRIIRSFPEVASVCVADVASAGGFVRQYNVVLDPQRMRDRGITMQKMRDAIRASNADVGGRTVELSEFEYVIRGRGYIKDINDLGNIVLKTDNGTPVLLRDVARVELGPDERRGITELNGEGEVTSGIILQRFGLNALDVINNVKERFKEIASSLPKSVEIVPVYDRSTLINAAIATLKHTLFEESIIVALVCIVFLLH
ncbi:efflux RND transporter permease subunit, partial [Aerococcus mictus]